MRRLCGHSGDARCDSPRPENICGRRQEAGQPLKRSQLTHAAVALAVTGLATTSVLAQSYPSRAIRLVVPYVPGGGTDFVGRTVAQKLSESLGATVFVENRPGGGTNIGS